MKREKRTVRLSFDVPIEEHIMIKTESVKSRIALKDFLHQIVQMGIKEYKKAQFEQRMDESIEQAKKGKTTAIDVSRFKEFVDE